MDQAETDAAPPICDRCGAYDAREIAGQKLCEACYVGAGSCCPGWGDEDESPGQPTCAKG